MAATPYILPRETRESGVLVGNGTVGPYAASAYKVFDTVDVKVFAKALGETVFSDVTAGCTIAKVNPASAYDYFTVTFGAAVPATTDWYHQARRVAERSVAVTKGGTLDSNQLEKELSKQATVESEVRRDLDRAVMVEVGTDPIVVIPGADGELVKFDIDGNLVTSGENVDTIEGSTAAAAASAAAAAGSAGAASGSAGASAASAAAAAASAASINLPAVVADTMLVAKSDASGYLPKPKADVRDFLDAVVYVADVAALAALDVTKDKAAVIYASSVRNGRLAFSSGNLSAQVTADPNQYTYVAPASAPTGAAGAWVYDSGLFVGQFPTPAIRSERSKLQDRCDLRDWNGLDLTDTNDNASLLTAAFAAVAISGDTLWMPAGTIAAGSTVNLPAQAKIQGEGAMGSIYGGLAMASQKKTVLHFGHTGVGLLANAAYGAEIRGITTYRTQPAPGAGWAPTAHDFDIKIVGSADVVLDGITILNGTKGILAIGDDTTTGAGCGRIKLRNIGGQPMNTGIELRNCYDVVWMDEIGFWPFWSNQADVRAYQRASGIAYNFFRLDNPKIGRMFSLGYLRTMAVSQGAAGVNFPASLPAGSVSKGYIDTLGGDSTATVLQLNAGASPTMVIDKLYGHSGAGWAANSYLVRDSGTNSRVSIGHLELGQNIADMVLMDGAGGLIMAGRAKVYQWDMNTLGASAFNIGAGNKLVVGPIDKDATTSPLFTAAAAGIVESDEWQAYTATVAAQTGTITTMGTQVTRYQRKARKVTLNFDIIITTIGTGATGVTITLPVTAAQGAGGTWVNTATNASGPARISAAGTQAFITPFPVASGQRFIGSIEYEVA